VFARPALRSVVAAGRGTGLARTAFRVVLERRAPLRAGTENPTIGSSSITRARPLAVGCLTRHFRACDSAPMQSSFGHSAQGASLDVTAMPTVVVAPDSFKGTMSADVVADALAAVCARPAGDR
jgi:hypothetical protein